MNQYKKIHWHEEARDYAKQWGLDPKDCELIMLNKERPILDPRSHEVGHLIVRYRSGDVVVVVGHREKDEPVIMSVWIDTSDAGYGAKAGITRKAGGSGSSVPKNIRELKKRILADGYKLEMGGSHTKVIDPKTGAFLCSLPNTPSDYRSVPNAWQLYLRKKIANEKKELSSE